MKIEKRDGSDERKILTAMIVNRSVLARLSGKWNKNLFRSKWSNLVAGWCFKFFEKYDKAPCRSIEGIFTQWANKSDDEKTVTLVEKFLSGLDGDYTDVEINPDYTVDMAENYFNRVKISNLLKEVEGSLEAGDLSKSLQSIEDFRKMEVSQARAIDPMQDNEALKEVFKQKNESLIQYPGALGAFFGDSLSRDSLISFLAPEKRGKSFWLEDIAWRGMLQRRRVAWFEVGDMSQVQVMARLATRASRQPLKQKSIKYPISLEHEYGDATAIVEHEIKEFEKPLSYSKVRASMDKILKRKIKSKNTYLKLSCHANSTMSVKGIESELESWELNEGWVPDIIVIDYADILLMGGSDERDKINNTWKALRALSQKLHCCVVTATQADANSYNSYLVKRSNFSGDKRKLAHVTGMIGINQTTDEKEDGLQRLNWVILRGDEFSENKCVHVANCLAIANPAVKSTF